MRQLIQKFFSNKRNRIIFIVLLAMILIFAIYEVKTIQKNMQKMTEAAEEAEVHTIEYPAINTAGKSAETIAQIKRGEYLAKAGDCIACHTNTTAHGVPYAGGLPMETPFGTIYSPNITPDKETGIGNWTDEDFIKAMREGISPHGQYYYPAFPYLYFNKISTADLKAIKAYFDNIPAISQKNLQNDMVFPFNIRFLQLGWRLLFFHPNDTDGLQTNPDQSEQWNRGAYLVEGLGHCAMCHSPSYYLINKKYSLGAPMTEYSLTGAKIQGYLAPNISKMNIENVPDDEFLQVFTHNRYIGGGKIQGPMLEANENSLKYLSKTDLLSIITYLKSIESKTPPKPKAGAGGMGKVIYQEYCEGCHANGGGGAPKMGDVAAWQPLLKDGIQPVYANAIKGKGGMPAKGSCFSCTEEDINQAVDYMVAPVLGKTSKPVATFKKLTLEDGKHIYDKNCSVCHATGFQNAPKLGDKPAWEGYVDAGFVDTYLNVVLGRKDHPPHGGCKKCSDADIKAAVKYMMTESSEKDYSLW